MVVVKMINNSKHEIIASNNAFISAAKSLSSNQAWPIMATTYVDVDKARDTDDANNNKTRFNVKNFVNVDNVYGTPDISFVSGETEAFKNVNLS